MDIINNIIGALPLLFSWQVILAMIVGTTIGIMVGALPGLSATMGIAVLIPITFTMQPLVALGMVAGIYNGAMYGGAIPAILLRIPGTPAGIATVFDGYPMAQQGKAPLALNISLASSAFGGAVSAMVLIALALPLASIALQFSPADYFWLAVFGMTAIAVLLSNNPVKGLLSTCLGLFVGLVGIDAISGGSRFTFGETNLVGGIGIIVVLTGLFAIPPAIDLVAKSLLQGKEARIDDSKEDKRFNYSRLLPTWLKSSAIGVGIGIIPAVGGNIAAVLAWNEQRRSDSRNENYGKGEPKGVAAPECANNADNAATLIPALTLGIPGNAVAAVILGALLVHGLRPGPELFTDDPEIVFGFMLAMFVTAIMMFFIGRLGARAFVYVLKVPPIILAPMIVAITIVGIYSINNNYFDVWLMLAFGVLGYVMEKYEFPTAPTVLAVILGPMAEESLRRSLLISRGTFEYLFSSGISLTIVGMILVTIGVPILRWLWVRRKSE